MTGPWRVVVVDDQRLFRSAIAALLDRQPDFEVVAEADDGLAGLEAAHRTDPDLVLMDVEMPVLDGVGAARRLREQLPATKVVLLTVCGDDDPLLESIRLGVHGYLLKDLHPDELFEQLRAVMRDETAVSPHLVTRLVSELRSSGSTHHPLPGEQGPAPLSQRELEIMRLVADGLTNREIGRQLVITEGTVKNHVHNALHKLGMDNRIQAAAYIVREGLGLPRR